MQPAVAPKAVSCTGTYPADGCRPAPAKPLDGVLTSPASAEKRYGFAAAEILGFQFLLNRFDNRFAGPDYDVSLGSIRRNLHRDWVEDKDPFATNQFGHPYQGATYFNLARSNGLNFWESFGYTFAGSAVWEIAGETTPPSRNDQITTSFAGSFLGESLYRMANYALEHRGSMSSGMAGLAATALSPGLAANRYFFPDRFSAVLASHAPATSIRFLAGASHAVRHHGDTDRLRQNEALAEFDFDYGLPGKAGYAYERPFDYFSFQARSSTIRAVESINTRGLIVGTAYDAGTAWHGIWGLYGSYDYLAPELFRLSSTALSLGTTGTLRISPAAVLQAHVAGGVGFTSTGSVQDRTARDYNYGFAPQGIWSLRLLLGDSTALDVTGRGYRAGRFAQPQGEGKDRVSRIEAGLTVRLHRRHGITLRYIYSNRDSDIAGLGARSQRRDTVGVYYTLLGGDAAGGTW